MVKQITWTDIRDSCLISEDNALLVLNKPAGISVIGDSDKNDLVTRAAEAGEKLIPVHRIDKETSGAVIFAKDPHVHAELTRQFAKRTVEKTYLAIVKSKNLPWLGTINLPLSTGRKNKIRIAAQRSNIIFDSVKNRWSVASAHILNVAKVYPSITLFAKVWEDTEYALLVVKPITGRTHQIRVHLAWIGYAIVGDPLFIDKTMSSRKRMFLHSWSSSFNETWKDNKRITIAAPPQKDFWSIIDSHVSPDFLLEQAQQTRESLKPELDN